MERMAREQERVRSMREEHVDGGFLVTQGVYTGTEDYNKGIVRQLMVRPGDIIELNHAYTDDVVDRAEDSAVLEWPQ